MKDLKKEFEELNKRFKEDKNNMGCSYDNEEVREKTTLESSSLSNRSTVILEDYIPDESKPLTFICVNIHVFQDSLGRGAFQSEDIPRLKMIFGWINHRFSFNYPPNYNALYTPKSILQQKIDSRIRFVVNRIEFYQDDNLCSTPANNAHLLLNAVQQRDSNMLKQLNIVINNPIPEPSYSGHAIFPSTNMALNQYVYKYVKRDNSNIPEPFPQGSDWWLSKHWCHELGHILGLCHTYIGGGCNVDCDESSPFYLYDIHGLSPNKICPIDASSTGNSNNNNLMAGGDSTAISTLQIATMHYALENYSVGKYAKNCFCSKCVAFGAGIARHKSQGEGQVLEYDKVFSNKPFAWDGKLFTCPVDGIYNFSLSFQKDSLIDGGTSNDVWIHLMADWEIIGTVWSEKADAKTTGIANVPQRGRRDSVSFSTNIKLKKGTIIKTIIKSHNNEKRNVVDVNLSGHLLCSDCC